jgi:hypothetical protein
MPRLIALKLLVILGVFILLVSTMFPFAMAQVGITTPSSPVFSVRYEIFSTDVEPVYDVNSSTGKAMITEARHTIVEEWAYVDIFNQPFVPYEDSQGNNVELFCNIRWKYSDNSSWIYLNEVKNNHGFTQTLNNEHSITSFGFRDNRVKGFLVLEIPIGSEVDFQVEASIGYYTADDVFVGHTSGWVDPQSVQHAGSYATATPRLSSTPSTTNPSTTTTSTSPNTKTVDWVGVALGMLLGIVVLLVCVVFYLRRRSVGNAIK